MWTHQRAPHLTWEHLPAQANQLLEDWHTCTIQFTTTYQDDSCLIKSRKFRMLDQQSNPAKAYQCESYEVEGEFRLTRTMPINESEARESGVSTMLRYQSSAQRAYASGLQASHWHGGVQEHSLHSPITY